MGLKVKVEYIRSFIAYCYYPLVEASSGLADHNPLWVPTMKKNKTFDIPHFDLFGSDH